MTWHKIISVERSFFGKYYKIKCEDGELFKKVPIRVTFGKPIAGAFIRVKANMFLGIRYEIMLNQIQRELVLKELSKYLAVLTPDEIIEMVDILRDAEKTEVKVKQTYNEYIKKTPLWNGEKLKMSAMVQIVNNQEHR
jgi:hypothetical protein